MDLLTENASDNGVNIKVIGVGRAGSNAVNCMLDANIRGIEFITVNTDRNNLMKSKAKTKVIIGKSMTLSYGAEGKPEVGKQAAEENIDDLKQILSGADMVFIVAGMGGGTGTGAAPVIAKLAKDMGILTIGIVTKPFEFEGSARLRLAEAGIEALKPFVDTLLVIPNEKFKQIPEQRVTLLNAFTYSNNILRHGVQSITDLITGIGLVNPDFSDVSRVMKEAGYAYMGFGESKGAEKAVVASKMALTCPLFENGLSNATSILLTITASPDISLNDVETATDLIVKEAHPDATIIWSLVFDENLEDTFKVTVIATGFNEKSDETVKGTD